MSSENVLAFRNLAIPLNTSKSTSWDTNAWIEWTEYVLQQCVDPEDAPSALINQMTKEELKLRIARWTISTFWRFLWLWAATLYRGIYKDISIQACGSSFCADLESSQARLKKR